jgi:outer membrane lipoprotein-sorting protein
MRSVLSTLAAVALFGAPLSAQTADSIIARYLRTVGGMEHIQAVQTLRRVGKVTSGGGFEAVVVQESKRPNKVREEFTIVGMTQIVAYDGQAGWKISPFQGKKDAEALSEDELRGMVEDADFDEPLVNYQQKGNRVEYQGTDQFEGTDVYKLKVTLTNGDSYTYFLDTDYCVPIKVEIRRTIRGTEQAYETVLGNYKAVAGWYLPFSSESRALGGSFGSKVTLDSIEVNVPIDDARFQQPAAPGAPSQTPGAVKPAGGIEQ